MKNKDSVIDFSEYKKAKENTDKVLKTEITDIRVQLRNEKRKEYGYVSTTAEPT